ncbi:MAG: ribbon-helix-helix protein, CopG family [Micrococcales bacterium]|nr:ribbon-helix-helix protein, CopG family [Micrococcales bacterium]
MIRTQISLEPDDRALLAELSLQTGRSMSALIREAVTRTYRQGAGVDRAAVVRSVAGSWVDRDEDGAAYVESLRTGARWSEVDR